MGGPLPERLAHASQDIGEGGVLLGVPGRATGGDGLPPLPDMGGQRQPAEEAQQGRGGAQNGLVRPLPLRLHAQIGAHGLKGHFHGPAPQVQGQDQGRRERGVGAEQGLGLLLLRRIPDQQPAQGDRGLPGVVPEGCVGHILQAPHRAVRPPLPERGPGGGGIGQHRVQGGQTGSLETRPPRLPRRPGWGRRIEGGIQPQAGQEGDGRGHALAGGQQAQRRVAPVAHHHQFLVGQPAPHTAQHLARPVRDRLVAALRTAW